MLIRRNRYFVPAFSVIGSGLVLRLISNGAGLKSVEAGPDPPSSTTFSTSALNFVRSGTTSSALYIPELS